MKKMNSAAQVALLRDICSKLQALTGDSNLQPMDRTTWPRTPLLGQEGPIKGLRVQQGYFCDSCNRAYPSAKTIKKMRCGARHNLSPGLIQTMMFGGPARKYFHISNSPPDSNVDTGVLGYSFSPNPVNFTAEMRKWKAVFLGEPGTVPQLCNASSRVYSTLGISRFLDLFDPDILLCLIPDASSALAYNRLKNLVLKTFLEDWDVLSGGIHPAFNQAIMHCQPYVILLFIESAFY